MDSLDSWMSLISGGYSQVRKRLNCQFLTCVGGGPRRAARGAHSIDVGAPINEQLALDDMRARVADVPPISVLSGSRMALRQRAQVGADVRRAMLGRSH